MRSSYGLFEVDIRLKLNFWKGEKYNGGVANRFMFYILRNS